MKSSSQGDWIEWSGGERPVDPEAMVFVKMRDGYVFTKALRAHALRWANDPNNHEGRFDIIAYRVVSQ